MSAPEHKQPEERKLTRRAVVAAGAVAAAGTGIGLGVVLATGPSGKPKLATRMTAAFRAGDIPLEDPTDGAWGAAKAIRVALSPQQISPPILHEASLGELTVRALHNGSDLGFLLEWDDPELDELDGISRFHDACAVQLPARASSTPPSVTMGGPGQPVHILQWRAAWQRDLAGRAGPEDLFPRIVRDLTPEDLLGPKTGNLFYVGRYVGNPVSVHERQPVEEVVAEGFGSATHLSRQQARGRGAHDGERWRVSIGIPLSREAGDALVPGTAWPVSFAVWLGSRKNRGGRKHWANWVRCELEPA